MKLAEPVLSGDLPRPVRLTVPEPLRRPQHRVEAGFGCATGGIRHHRFTGPRPVRRPRRRGAGIRPGAPQGPAALPRRRHRQRRPPRRAVPGEFDPDFADAPVLLGVRIDDTPLDAAGPRPVLPQDRCGVRHISGISAIRADGGHRRGAPVPAAPGRAAAAPR